MLINTHFKSNSPFVPEFIVPLEKDSIDSSLVAKLKEIIYTEEDYIMKTFSKFTNSSLPDDKEDWITNRAFEYNLLKFSDKYPELDQLKTFISNQYKNYVKQLNLPEEVVYIQVWINILRKDSRHFTRHHHAHVSRLGDPSYAYISGNISIEATDTNTYYQNPVLDTKFITIKNISGESILFPSWMIHWTDVNKSEEPRLSIAFDIITEELYNMRLMDNPDNFIKLD